MICPSLETARLILRPVEGHDQGDLARLDTDIEVMRYLDGRTLSAEESRARFDTIFETDWPEGFGVWHVSQKDSGDFVGTVVLRTMLFVPAHLGDPELGYKLVREAWGKGLAEEAAGAVLQHGLCSLELVRVSAVTDLGNKASQRILRKLGFDYAGVEFYVASPEARPEAVHFFCLEGPKDWGSSPG